MAGLRETIRTQAEVSGLSLAELARRVGISRVSLSRYLHGHSGLSADSLERILDELGLHLSEGPQPKAGKKRKSGD